MQDEHHDILTIQFLFWPSYRLTITKDDKKVTFVEFNDFRYLDIRQIFDVCRVPTYDNLTSQKKKKVLSSHRFTII